MQLIDQLIATLRDPGARAKRVAESSLRAPQLVKLGRLDKQDVERTSGVELETDDNLEYEIFAMESQLAMESDLPNDG